MVRRRELIVFLDALKEAEEGNQPTDRASKIETF
jgi:hypothetical protein